MKLFDLLPWKRSKATVPPLIGALSGTIEYGDFGSEIATSAAGVAPEDCGAAQYISTEKACAALADFLSETPNFAQAERFEQLLKALVSRHFASAPCSKQAVLVINQMFGHGGPGEDLQGLDGRDRLFASNLLRLGSYAQSGGRANLPGPVTTTGQDEDCLASAVDEWSVFRLLNLAVMSSIQPRRRTAIVTSIRNEGLAIVEWLAFHRAIGFDTFFVYTNDNTDESDNLLRTLSEHGVIRLIGNRVDRGVRVQAKVLEHSLALLPDLRDFEWAFFIDVDEFFIPRCEPGLTLGNFYEDYTRAFTGDKPSAIAFNWKWFGSENAFDVTDGLLLERFTHSIHNEHVKSLVRIRDVVSMGKVHVPILVDGAWMVNSDFRRIEPSIHMQPTYGKGQINHYWNKSFKEFMLKRARGRISAGVGSPPLDFSTFFDWGANSRRGNLDPPDGRILDRTRSEYDALLRLPSVELNLMDVKARSAVTLQELGASLDLAGIYERRGRA